MGTMLEYLEQEKQNILAETDRAGDARQAAAGIASCLDRVLFRYNQSCSSDERARTAADLMQTLRMCLPLLDCQGEDRVWERQEGEGRQRGDAADPPRDGRGSRGKKKFFSATAILLGVICLMAGLWLSVGGDSVTRRLAVLLPVFLLTAAGGGLLYFAGRTAKALPSAGKKSYLVEHRLDGERVYRALRGAVLMMDQRLEALSDRTREEGGKQTGSLLGESIGAGGEEAAPHLSKEAAELFGDLLEAEYSGDGIFALERVSQVRHFLSQKGIQVVDLSPDTAAWFDLMPAKQSGTIRPALVCEGALLRKGLARQGAAEE